jgi:hypothetical protein
MIFNIFQRSTGLFPALCLFVIFSAAAESKRIRGAKDDQKARKLSGSVFSLEGVPEGVRQEPPRRSLQRFLP